MHFEQDILTGVGFMFLLDLLNGTRFSSKEFWDNLCLCIILEMLGIQIQYNGCRENLIVENAFQCRKCGIIIAHHDNLADKWGALSARELYTKATPYK